MTRLATGRALSNLERQLNTIFNTPFISSSGRAEDLGFAGAGPAIDIMEDQEAFYLTADLPGFNQENVQVRYENRTLTLSGERRQEETNGVRYHRTESFTGRFQRSFSLPFDIDVEKIEAELKNGVLTITLPKQEASKPRQISVKVE
jgi:HSP20 family protein